MAQRFNPASFADGVTVVRSLDFQNLAADIVTPATNIDAGGYARVNNGFLSLLAGDRPGVAYSVTGATWSGGVVTLTIGAHNLQARQRISIAGITPSGYNSNGSDTVPITAVTGTTVSYALASNPGTYSSGGTVTSNGVAAANGMLAVNPSGYLDLYSNGAWPTWTAPTLLNSWANFGSGYQTASYRRDPFGRVWLRGELSGGTTTDGTAIFTLPAGFRPLSLELFLASGGTVSAFTGAIEILVDTSGNVKLFGMGSATLFSLAGISFMSF